MFAYDFDNTVKEKVGIFLISFTWGKKYTSHIYSPRLELLWIHSYISESVCALLYWSLPWRLYNPQSTAAPSDGSVEFN